MAWIKDDRVKPKEKGTRGVIVVGIATFLAAIALYFATRKAKAAPPTVYTCPYCGATFPSQEELQAHITAEHPEQPPVYVCPICGTPFATEEELAAHVELEHPEVGVAKFEYVSDIRRLPFPGATWGGIKFEVDIKNTGTVKGTITATGYIETCYGYNTVSMGTKEIIPGQTFTFSGQWEWRYGPMEADEWWRPGYIQSEAGLISFLFGRSLYPVSFDIPQKVASGSEFWVTQVIHLPYRTPLGFYSRLLIGYTPPRLTNPVLISAALVATAGKDGDILLTGEKDYTIRGIYQRGISYPAKAIYNAQTVSTAPPNWQPIPPGIYKVTWLLYYDDAPPGYTGFKPVWDTIVGQVEIV